MSNQGGGYAISPPESIPGENEGVCRPQVRERQSSATSVCATPNGLGTKVQYLTADKRLDNNMDRKCNQQKNSNMGFVGITNNGLDLKGFFEPTDKKSPVVPKGNNATSFGSNDDRKRAHKESVTTRHSAGGSNKGAMKPETQPLILPDNATIESPKELERFTVIKPASEEDLVNREWGVYTAEPCLPEQSWSPNYSQIIRGGIAGFLIAYIIRDKFDYITIILAFASAVAVALANMPWFNLSEIILGGVAGLLVAFIFRNEIDYAAIIFALASALAVALMSEVPQFNRGPSLEGAGSNVDLRGATPTAKGHVDSLAFTAWQEGRVYNCMSAKLISQFVGCKIDEHVVRRAMKRADELQSLYATPLDRGVMADTVSYSLCVVNVEMARAGSSIRPTKIVPWSGAWS
jgi:hypothetical protein